MHAAEPIFEIRCPRCSGLARFEDPYEFIGVPTPKVNSPLWQLPRYSTWFVREKFPSLFPWKGSDEYAKQLHAWFRDDLRPGVALCSQCGEARVHRLRWPQDAFWQWEVRGQVLWAFSRRHAVVLREFINRTHREPKDFETEFIGFLVRIPSTFLRAQVRRLVVGKIDKLLSATKAS